MFFKKSQEIITILINNSNLTFCSWASSDKLTFKSFYQYKLQHEILDLEIFNSTKIENIIDTFLHNNNISNPLIYISFDGSLLKELIIENEIKPEFEKQKKDNFNYNQFQINESILYCVGIKQTLIFQYQLLFIKLKLNLFKISTEFVSLINLANIDLNNLQYSLKDLAVNEFKNNILNSINFDFEKYITNNSIKDLDKFELIKSVGLFIKEI